VVECFFGKLIREKGLKPWPGVEDPLAVARGLCQDFRDEDSDVLEAAAEAIASQQSHRLPSVKQAREAVKAARQAKRTRGLAAERERERARQAAEAQRAAAVEAYHRLVRTRVRELLAAVDPEIQEAWRREFADSVDPLLRRFTRGSDWWWGPLWADARRFLEDKLGAALPSEAEHLAAEQGRLPLDGGAAKADLLDPARAA
jgi:hypothetical protein